MITLDEVMARSDDAVRHASAYWLATAYGLLRATEPLTPEQRRRRRLIETELRGREIQVPR